MNFNTSINSPVLIILTIIFFIVSSVKIFDTRLIQAKKSGIISVTDPSSPGWIALFYWFWIILMTAIFILNWKYGIAIFIINFILEVIPSLEILGNILMRPFRPR